jgi:hypothetical protein
MALCAAHAHAQAIRMRVARRRTASHLCLGRLLVLNCNHQPLQCAKAAGLRAPPRSAPAVRCDAIIGIRAAWPDLGRIGFAFDLRQHDRCTRGASAGFGGRRFGSWLGDCCRGGGSSGLGCCRLGDRWLGGRCLLFKVAVVVPLGHLGRLWPVRSPTEDTRTGTPVSDDVHTACAAHPPARTQASWQGLPRR